MQLRKFFKKKLMRINMSNRYDLTPERDPGPAIKKHKVLFVC